MHAAGRHGPVLFETQDLSAKTFPSTARIKTPVSAGVCFQSSMQNRREEPALNFWKSSYTFRIISVHL